MKLTILHCVGTQKTVMSTKAYLINDLYSWFTPAIFKVSGSRKKKFQSNSSTSVFTVNR